MILTKLVILEMGVEEIEVGAVTEKRESYVIFYFFYNKPRQIFGRREDDPCLPKISFPLILFFFCKHVYKEKGKTHK